MVHRLFSDTSTSSSDEEEFGSKQSEIEFKILKKELEQITQKCDCLKEENRVSCTNFLWLNFNLFALNYCSCIVERYLMKLCLYFIYCKMLYRIVQNIKLPG